MYFHLIRIKTYSICSLMTVYKDQTNIFYALRLFDCVYTLSYHSVRKELPCKMYLHFILIHVFIFVHCSWSARVLFCLPPPQKKIIIIRKIRNNTNLEEICCLLLIFYTATCMFSYIVLLMWCSSFIIFIYSQHGDTVPNISIPQIWWFTKSQMWKTLYKTTQCKYYNTCMYSYNTGTCTDSS